MGKTGAGKSRSKAIFQDSRVYFSILLVSCVIWSDALDSYGVLLSYSIISIAYNH